MPLIKKSCETFTLVASSLRSPFLLTVRLYWGWQFAISGWGKVTHLHKVISYFTSLDIPFPFVSAHFIAGLELVGGILFLVGLFSRPIALLLTVAMIGAYVSADYEAFTSFLSDPDTFIAATPFPFLFASMIILIFGPGRFSMDAFFPSALRKI